MWASIGGMVGGAIDPQHIEGPSLGDLSVQVTAEGAPRAIVMGRPQPFSGMPFQWGDYVPITVEHEQGKGGGPVVEENRVLLTYAIGICEGPATCIRAWRDERLVYDATGTGTIEPDMYAILSKVRFYTGDETQNPDPSLEALPTHRGGGVGEVPSYRGTAYMVVTLDDVTEMRGRIPQWKFEMASNATVTETCGEVGQLWHFPLSDAVAGGIATELVEGANGEYGSDSDFLTAGPNLHALGQASARFIDATNFGACMLAPQVIVDGLQLFSMASRPNWTVMCWFKCEDEIGGSQWKNIVTCWGDTFGGQCNWQFILRDDDNNMTPRFRMNWDDESGEVQLIGTPVLVGGSHFLAATYRGDTGTLTFYQDGQAVDSDTIAFGLFEGGGPGIDVGGGSYFPASTGFTGCVQDVMAFNITMTAEDIFNRFNANPDAFREAPDVPGTYVRRVDGYTVSQCSMTAEISDYMLSDAVTEIARRCGIASSWLDVTEDEDVPVNVLFGRAGLDGVGAMTPLALLHFRDYVDIGGYIVSVPRGGDEAFDITYDDCLDYDDQELSLRQRIELPKRMYLRYWNREVNAAQLAGAAEREAQDVSSQGQAVLEAPMVFDTDIAAQKQVILTKIAAEEATGTLKIALPFYRYAYLTPSDCGRVNGKRYRIVRQQIDGGRMELELLRDRVSNYSSNATGSTAIDPATYDSSLKGPTWFQALNLPRLNTAQNQPGMVTGATGATSGWPGAYLMVSFDGGTTFQTAKDTSGQPITFGRRSLMGHIAEDVAAGTEPILVQTWDGRDLPSLTDAQNAARLGAFAVTTEGVSEIKQYRDAEESETTDNEFSLSTISHGLLNTTDAEHFYEDEVLFLDESLKFVAIPIEYAGQEIIFWPITRGTPPENNPKVTVTFDPQFTGPSTFDFYTNAAGEKYTDEFGAYYYRE